MRGWMAFHVGGVQRLTVVDNSDFSLTHLTVPLAFFMLASCGVLPSPECKQRGVVWPFTCSYVCSCSWSASSSLGHYFGVWTGSRFSVTPHEAWPSAAGSSVCSSHALLTIATLVVSPPLPRLVLGQRQLRCVPGAR